MNKAVKREWIKALKSGKYKQGKNKLCHAGRYCCLGVLTDLAIKHEVCTKEVYKHEAGILSKVVMDWAGLDDPNPNVSYKGIKSSLAEFNDGEGGSDCNLGLNFNQIANVIQRNL